MMISRIQQNRNNYYTNIRPVFTGKSSIGYSIYQMQDYINGKIPYSPKDMDNFEQIICDKNLDMRDLSLNPKNRLFDFVAENLQNPYNARLLIEFPYDVNPKKIFVDANIHKGLARLNYRNPENKAKLKNMYDYICSNQCLKEHNLFPVAAIREAIMANNIEYLSYLMDERRMIPAYPDGSVDPATIIMGRNSSNGFIRDFFDEEYLLRKTSQRAYFIPSLYNDTPKMRSLTDSEIDEIMNSKPTIKDLANDSFFEEPIYEGDLRSQAETIKRSSNPAEYGISQADLDKSVQKVSQKIQEDEEKYGQVRFRTLSNIAADYKFSMIKNSPLNITGCRLVHLIAETPVEPSEQYILDEVFENLKKYGADFNIFDDFGETALRRAVEAENYPVIKKLLQDCKANPYAAGKDAQCAYTAAMQSDNAKIAKLFMKE